LPDEILDAIKECDDVAILGAVAAEEIFLHFGGGAADENVLEVLASGRRWSFVFEEDDGFARGAEGDGDVGGRVDDGIGAIGIST